MTLFSIDHAVVMDTDDIPGRGGYALVGVSRGVSQTERAFVAQNFGISDYLHDTKLQKRMFYSFFRVPGGRRAFVRRFAKGERRNKTQNRLFVHTLFLDDALFERLHAVPWLLVNASVRAHGRTAWERLTDDVPWHEESGALPQLEWDSDDGAADGVAAFLEKRLALLAKQIALLPAGGEKVPEGRMRGDADEMVARVITALSANPRVVLPQGHAYELLTTLAWSMLPWRDHEEIAWTQHDAMSGLAFGLANAAGVETVSLDAPAAQFARDIVSMNTASEDSWREFHQRSWDQPGSIRDPKSIAAWLAWRKAVKSLREQRRVPETAGEYAAIFRATPDRDWLDRMAKEVGADMLVRFFLAGTPAPAREAIASWLIEPSGAAHRSTVSEETLATLAAGLAADRSPQLPAILEALLATDAGVASLTGRANSAELVAAAMPLVIRNVFAEPQRTLPLAREIMSYLSRTGAAANAISLAIAMADAGEPASGWFRVLLQVAASIDAKGDEAATKIFLDAVSRLRRTSLALDGAMEPLVEFLRGAAELRAKQGECIRALILLVQPVWRSRAGELLEALTALVEQSYFAGGWEPVILAAVSQLRGKEVSALVAAYWTRADPSAVSGLDRRVIDAIGAMNDDDRRRVGKTWEGRIRRLPEGGLSDLLVDRLYGEREPRVPLAWRQIEQGTADIATLNRLDAGLWAETGPRYEREMAGAIEKFVGSGSGARRLARLCELLASNELLPSVKHVIETHLLRKAAKLKRAEWRRVYRDLREEALFAPGVPALILGHGIGAGADEETIAAFEGVCRSHGRSDVLQAVAAGRQGGGGVRRLFRAIGMS